ncbi:palmitoyltransferase [Coemansia sp. Benny D115]|nr:palmitoyltransferase [Coemansia sp. Benny D115]
MKVYHLAVIRLPAQQSASSSLDNSASSDAQSLVLNSVVDLSSFSFFQRSSVEEFLNFFTVTIAERTPAKGRQSVPSNENGEYVIHVMRGTGDLCVTVTTDKEYPHLVAHSLAGKVLDDFTRRYTPQQAGAATRTNELSFPELADYFEKYQDPKQADNILRVQQELEQTKIVMHKTIEGLLDRENKLNSLVDRSSQLSSYSKAFYKTAKKTNSCCVIM